MPHPCADWADDALLAAAAEALRMHDESFSATLQYIVDTEGSLHDFCFANGLHRFGLHRAAGGWHFREWAPSALACSLVGEFNEWDSANHPGRADSHGVFHGFVPDAAGLRPGDRYKLELTVRSRAGTLTRIHCVPAWARCTQQDTHTGELYALVPPDDLLAYPWRHPRKIPPPETALRIYEAHVGISSSEPVVADWEHFRVHVLPRVAALGYTALLLIAAQEHGYYASLGYQVTSFFAPPSRFGSPSQLQALVDDAHGYGMRVLFEVVHSHASSNVSESLIETYFLPGGDGWHAEWGTRMFDFGRLEVIRFLLSQLCWYARRLAEGSPMGPPPHTPPTSYPPRCHRHTPPTPDPARCHRQVRRVLPRRRLPL